MEGMGGEREGGEEGRDIEGEREGGVVREGRSSRIRKTWSLCSMCMNGCERERNKIGIDEMCMQMFGK